MRSNMANPNIIPPHDSRSIVVGKTDSGKSTLSIKLLEVFENDGSSIIVLDPKCSRTLSVYPNTDIPGELNRLSKEHPIVVYRAAPDIEGIDHWDVVLKWVYDRQNTVLCIDELFGLSDNGYTYPKWLKGIYTRGRERGITVIGQSQRPKGIPRYCKTETEGAYIFQLDIDDRTDMSREFGKEILIPPEEHAFWFSYKRSKPIQLRLKL